MAFVLDTSVAGLWYLPDEHSEYAERVLQLLHVEGAVAPDLWAVELANVLVTAERRRRITKSDRAEAVRVILNLPINLRVVPFNSVMERILDLADAQRLTAYDAVYLDLAMRERLRLATLDTDLRAAAVRVGVELVE